MLFDQLGRKDIDKACKSKYRGDGFLKKYQLIDAIDSYNASICYAPFDSPQLRTGYVDRAAVFAKIGLYDEAISSIDLALEVQQSDEDREELELQKKEFSEKRLKYASYYASQLRKVQFAQLSHGSHKNVPFASEMLEIQESDQFGRYLVAKQDLRPG